MTPNLLQDNASAILQLYAEAEERMLQKVAKRLSRGIEEEGWAERKLREVQQMRQEIQKELDRLESEGRKLSDEMISDAYRNGADGFEDAYRQYGGMIRAIPQSRINAVVELQNELNANFDAQRSRILRDVDDQYRSIIGNAIAMQSAGVSTTQESIKAALNQFADRGITGFVDKVGRKWQMDSYAEMAVRTGMMRAALQGYKDDAIAHGEDLVIISDHQDSCPLCADWERVVLSLTGAMLNHPDCEGLFDDAVAAGLFHPNCLHSYTVYIPGLTLKEGSKERQGYTREMNEEGYKNRQLQRYMENNVRRWKRRQAVATTPEDERYCKAYVSRWQAKLRQLVDDAGLPRKYNREGGRVKLSDAAKKLPTFKLTYDKKSSIIKLSDIVIPRSLGAKALNYDVLDLETMEVYHFAEGSHLSNVYVFAGKGVKDKYKNAYKYANKFGGNVDDWQHVKGDGILVTDDGDRKAEVHWSQCEGFGKHDFFVKKWKDEG